MARINIEEKWWNDPRRRLLRNLLQRDAADQVAVNAWRLGYDYWCERTGSSLIPGHVFIYVDGYSQLIESGLAILYRNIRLVDPINFRTQVEHIPTDLDQQSTDPNTVKQCSVYLAGTRDCLLNLMENRHKKSLAGRKSVQKRLETYGTSQPKLEHKPNTPRTAPNSAELSSSSSSSSSSSFSSSKKNIAAIRMNYPEPFEKAWIAYGRKGEKKASFAEWQKLKLDEGEFNQLMAAIQNYFVSKPDPTYRKDFERFLKSDWREWLDPAEHATSALSPNERALQAYAAKLKAQTQSPEVSSLEESRDA